MINLSEIDLVVLNRNSIDDATHTDGHYSFYVGKDKNYFFSSCDKAWRGTWKNVDILKPIEKTMKEYLNKETHEFVRSHSELNDMWIEIPDGSCTATERRGDIVFWDNDGARTPFKGKFDIFIDEAIDKLDAKIIWKRQTHPEELPFIDDDFKLNIPEELKGRADLLSGRIIIDDEPLKVIDSEYSKDGNSVTHTVSLNDQYAEIEKVRQSAWQKQEGGNHYKNLKIQPMQYALENKLDYAQANVVKYVTRHKEKNGKEDLLKAIHNIELMIEFYYGDEE